MASNTLHCKLIFLSFKGNIIWTCYVGPVTSLSVALISFAKKVAIDFCQFFSQLLRMLFSDDAKIVRSGNAQCKTRESPGHVGFENVNCTFGSEKSLSSAGCGSVSLELLAYKPKEIII